METAVRNLKLSGRRGESSGWRWCKKEKLEATFLRPLKCRESYFRMKHNSCLRIAFIAVRSNSWAGQETKKNAPVRILLARAGILFSDKPQTGILEFKLQKYTHIPDVGHGIQAEAVIERRQSPLVSLVVLIEGDSESIFKKSIQVTR